MKKLLYFMCVTFCWGQVTAQYVGIGTTTPITPLHIKSGEAELLRIEGTTPYVSFFNGTTYKGYLWYDGSKMVLGTSTNEPVVISPFYTISPAYFTPTGRLGLGISNPAEKLDVDGNINLNGVLKVNGSSGTAGQVLTSNGTGDPVWKEAAYNNMVRFSFNMNSANANQAEDSMTFNFTNYNLTPAAVSVSGTSLNISQSGLYHFEIYLYAEVGSGSALNFIPNLSLELRIGSRIYQLAFEPLNNPSPLPTTQFTQGKKYNTDLYISAPSVIKIHRFYSGIPGGSNSYGFGYLTGYLINN